MNPVHPDSFRLPVRILSLGGLAGLAILTVAKSGATRMFATPWILILAGICALPPALLLLRLASRTRPLALPAAGWMLPAVAAIILPVISALASPYRGPALLNAGVPLAAASLFLLLHDWLQANPERNRARLEQALVLAASLIVLASTLYWLRDIARLSMAELFSAVPFHMRNPYPLGHSNYTAGLMLLCLPVLARATWRSRGTIQAATGFATALALLNLFTSGSRGGLIGLAVMAVAGVAMAGLSRKQFVLLTTGLVAVTGLLAVANPRVRALLRPRDFSDATNVSTVQRSAMLRAGVMMGMDRPLLGWGPGTTPLAYPRYRHALNGGAENVLQLHNTPLQLWAETGATSLLAALLLGGLLARNRARAPLAAVTLAGYGVFALTDYQLDLPVVAAVLAALTALLAAPAATPAGPRNRLGLGLAVFAAAGLIVGLGARDPTPVLNNEALALIKLPGQHQQAVARFNESLALNPDQELVHFNLGWMLLIPDPAGAERHFLAAARLVPDKGGVYFGLGLARMNQGHHDSAVHAFALECLNDPRFLVSPWWTVPAIAAKRDATAAAFATVAARVQESLPSSDWAHRQAALLATLAPRLGRPSPGPELAYRRERSGYPVLMRNSDFAPPIDLYDVREDPRFQASVSFPLPAKGWMPSPLLLKLLDAAPPSRQ